MGKEFQSTMTMKVKPLENEIVELKDSITSSIAEKEILQQKVVELETDIRVKEEKLLAEISLQQEQFQSSLSVKVKPLEDEIVELKSNIESSIAEKEVLKQ